METINLLYKQGVFFPLTPINLPELAEVSVQIIAYGDAPRDESLESFSAEQIKAHPLLAIANLGRSGRRDIAERDEELLSADIHPIYGWSIHHDESANDH